MKTISNRRLPEIATKFRYIPQRLYFNEIATKFRSIEYGGYYDFEHI